MEEAFVRLPFFILHKLVTRVEERRYIFQQGFEQKGIFKQKDISQLNYTPKAT